MENYSTALRETMQTLCEKHGVSYGWGRGREEPDVLERVIAEQLELL